MKLPNNCQLLVKFRFPVSHLSCIYSVWVIGGDGFSKLWGFFFERLVIFGVLEFFFKS